jgi:hypothetical protein
MLIDQAQAITLALGQQVDRVHRSLKTPDGPGCTVNAAFRATSTSPRGFTAFALFCSRRQFSALGGAGGV